MSKAVASYGWGFRITSEYPQALVLSE